MRLWLHFWALSKVFTIAWLYSWSLSLRTQLFQSTHSHTPPCCKSCRPILIQISTTHLKIYLSYNFGLKLFLDRVICELRLNPKAILDLNLNLIIRIFPLSQCCLNRHLSTLSSLSTYYHNIHEFFNEKRFNTSYPLYEDSWGRFFITKLDWELIQVYNENNFFELDRRCLGLLNKITCLHHVYPTK